jgi:hypothetical protein
LTEPRAGDDGADALPWGVGRLALFVLGPVFFAVPALYVVAIIGFRDYRAGVAQPASEEFFWIAAAVIPLALLLATWLLPRGVPASDRSLRVRTSGHVAPLGFYDDIRLILAWMGCVAIAALAVAGAIASLVALGDCTGYLGTCGSSATHRLATYGLIAVGAELVVLAGIRLLAHRQMAYLHPPYPPPP